MPKVEDLFRAIFVTEVTRLYDLTVKGPLDMADIVKLEKLVGAHSKFKPDPTQDTDLANISIEELLDSLNRNDTGPKTT